MQQVGCGLRAQGQQIQGHRVLEGFVRYESYRAWTGRKRGGAHDGLRPGYAGYGAGTVTKGICGERPGEARNGHPAFELREYFFCVPDGLLHLGVTTVPVIGGGEKYLNRERSFGRQMRFFMQQLFPLPTTHDEGAQHPVISSLPLGQVGFQCCAEGCR